MICNRCDCKEECGYYKESVEPVAKAVSSLCGEISSEYEIKLVDALDSLVECEYFEEAN